VRGPVMENVSRAGGERASGLARARLGGAVGQCPGHPPLEPTGTARRSCNESERLGGGLEAHIRLSSE
jgi:hypothetical protein